MTTQESRDRNDFCNFLIGRGADNDSAAINVLDMIDRNENGARTATAETLRDWYEAGRA